MTDVRNTWLEKKLCLSNVVLRRKSGDRKEFSSRRCIGSRMTSVRKVAPKGRPGYAFLPPDASLAVCARVGFCVFCPCIHVCFVRVFACLLFCVFSCFLVFFCFFLFFVCVLACVLARAGIYVSVMCCGCDCGLWVADNSFEPTACPGRDIGCFGNEDRQEQLCTRVCVATVGYADSPTNELVGVAWILLPSGRVVHWMPELLLHHGCQGGRVPSSEFKFGAVAGAGSVLRPKNHGSLPGDYGLRRMRTPADFIVSSRKVFAIVGFLFSVCACFCFCLYCCFCLYFCFVCVCI